MSVHVCQYPLDDTDECAPRRQRDADKCSNMIAALQLLFSFLSDEHLDVLRFASEKARELGLRFDLTLGSGWPYGGPSVPVTQAAGKLRVSADAKQHIEWLRGDAAIGASAVVRKRSICNQKSKLSENQQGPMETKTKWHRPGR